MKPSRSAFVCPGLLLVALLVAGETEVVAAGSKVDPVSRGLRERTAAALQGWKVDGGKEFKSGLTYVDGVPALMLLTTADETKEKALRRRREFISACEVLLEDSEFPTVWMCVVTVDPAKPSGQTTKTYKVERGEYEQAVKSVSKSGQTKDGIKKAREDEATLAAICKRLGID